MQKSIIVWISGGGASFTRSLAYVLGVCIKIFKNFVPSKHLRHKLKMKQDKFFGYSYNILTADEYIDKFNSDTSTYMLDDKKVYIFKDFYVSAFQQCWSYIHDKDENILLQSVSASIYKKSFPRFEINMRSTKIINLDEAVDLAIMFCENYWHFTFTALDKIINFEENGYRGKYIIPNREYIKELLLLTGIPQDRFVFPDEKSIYKVKSLHVLDYVYHNSFEDGIQANFYTMKKVRELILSHIDLNNTNEYPKRIFVKRIGVRKIENEVEVESFLNKYGFKTIIPEDYSVEEQIKHFYAADIVFCAHGANSTNALYMRPNTHFIETFGANYIRPCMLDIIKVNKLNYHMIVENAWGTQFKKSFNDNNVLADYWVDLSHLDSVLYNLVSNSSCKSCEKIL